MVSSIHLTLIEVDASEIYDVSTREINFIRWFFLKGEKNVSDIKR